MTQIVITHDISAEILSWHGGDADICRAAWVSSHAEEPNPEPARMNGLIRSLLREKHGTPFEAGYIEFRIDAPRAVRDEHVRHRIGSYSSASSRYRTLDPVYYIPPPNRPLVRDVSSKQMRAIYDLAGKEDYDEYATDLAWISEQGRRLANKWLDRWPKSTEAVRWFYNDDNLMTPYIARFNPRMMLSFLELRTHDDRANHPSFPMWEIEQIARQIEMAFAERWPATYAAWNDNGREAP